MKVKDLAKIKLPLSQTDYEELQKALFIEQVVRKDLSTKLKFAYQDYGKPMREAKWKEMLEKGIVGEYN